MRNTSPIPYSKWLEIEKKAEAAMEAISELNNTILFTAQNVDKETQDILFKEAARVNDAAHSFHGPYFWHPQPEYVGNDKFVYREPHVMGFRRYTVEDVEENKK